MKICLCESEEGAPDRNQHKARGNDQREKHEACPILRPHQMAQLWLFLRLQRPRQMAQLWPWQMGLPRALEAGWALSRQAPSLPEALPHTATG